MSWRGSWRPCSPDGSWLRRETRPERKHLPEIPQPVGWENWASKSPSSSLYHPNPLVTPCPFPPDSAILSSASKLASGGAAILGTRPFLPFKTRLPVSLCMRAKSLHSCRTLCNAVDCSPPGSSVRGILQARILEWVAVPSSRGSSRPRDQTRVS